MTSLIDGLNVAPKLVSTAPSAAFYVAVFAYGIATIFYASAYIQCPDWMKKSAKWILVAAFVCHGIDIGLRGVEGVHPGTSVRESIGFLSWVVVGGFLIFLRGQAMAMVGALVAPATMAMLIAARLSPTGGPVTGLSSLGRIHIALATGGVAIFALATAVSIAYLVHEKNLKNKKFDGVLFKQGAALETMDQISAKLVLVGFPLFTVAMVLGVLWVTRRGVFTLKIEHVLSLIIWMLFGYLIGTRKIHGTRGRRAAWLTISGFLFSMMVVAVYFIRRVWG